MHHLVTDVSVTNLSLLETEFVKTRIKNNSCDTKIKTFELH